MATQQIENVIIRPVKPNEREAWEPLWKGYQF